MIIKQPKITGSVMYNDIVREHLQKRVNEIECEVDIAIRSGRNETFINHLKNKAVVLSQELDPYIVEAQRRMM